MLVCNVRVCRLLKLRNHFLLIAVSLFCDRNRTRSAVLRWKMSACSVVSALLSRLMVINRSLDLNVSLSRLAKLLPLRATDVSAVLVLKIVAVSPVNALSFASKISSLVKLSKKPLGRLLAPVLLMYSCSRLVRGSSVSLCREFAPEKSLPSSRSVCRCLAPEKSF